MSVNYTGEGTYATYGGKLSAPVSMVMDLGFKELEPIYSGDYEENKFGLKDKNRKTEFEKSKGVGY
jgi:hypothetical protein